MALCLTKDLVSISDKFLVQSVVCCVLGAALLKLNKLFMVSASDCRQWKVSLLIFESNVRLSDSNCLSGPPRI